eukprot:CAMPEP_0174829526 /NCGR_PEP_ID=MMETSP1114-20130205/1976_1 /TAXON_ID=312471 /ORGANISM="Neobodo designis, Strain CCAP 1951/1" /LENGTH=137 /DNA_ID=CAMNT_0016063277 /DNA_START=285 /DNA_END=698 /DNA_ORIENTATION=-
MSQRRGSIRAPPQALACAGAAAVGRVPGHPQVLLVLVTRPLGALALRIVVATTGAKIGGNGFVLLKRAPWPPAAKRRMGLRVGHEGVCRGAAKHTTLHARRCAFASSWQDTGEDAVQRRDAPGRKHDRPVECDGNLV